MHGLFHTRMEVLFLAAQIKATHALSVVDAWIAAAALYSGTTLLDKDPEFQASKVLLRNSCCDESSAPAKARHS